MSSRNWEKNSQGIITAKLSDPKYWWVRIVQVQTVYFWLHMSKVHLLPIFRHFLKSRISLFQLILLSNFRQDFFILKICQMTYKCHTNVGLLDDCMHCPYFEKNVTDTEISFSRDAEFMFFALPIKI